MYICIYVYIPLRWPWKKMGLVMIVPTIHRGFESLKKWQSHLESDRILFPLEPQLTIPFITLQQHYSSLMLVMS